MTDSKLKPAIDPGPPRLIAPLIIVASALVIIALVVLFLGKLILAGLIALLGAVFGVGAQVSKSSKL